MDPAGDAVSNVDAVRMQRDAAGALERFQPFDGPHQFHAVVGGQRLAAGKLALLGADAQQRAPAAWAGIPAAGAIGEYLDFGQVVQATSSRGSLKIMRSGVWSACSSVTTNRAWSASITSRTRISGAEAPAVNPSVAGLPSQSQSI